MARTPVATTVTSVEPEPVETFTQLAREYLAETPLRPATVQDYLQIAQIFDTDMSSPALSDISRDLLLRWRRAVLARASPTSWNTYFTHWRAIWRWAVTRGLVEHDPLPGTKWSCRVPRKPPRTVSHQVLDGALALVENHRAFRPGWFWTLVLRTLYFTGIRRRQLVELRWGDVDLLRQRLKLRSEGSKTHREWDIVLHPECAKGFVELHERFRQHSGRSPQDEEQVFNVTLYNRRYAGNTLKEEQLSGFFKRLSRHLGQPCSAHRLRHTLATDLINRPRANLKSIQELLGHTDIRTTLGYMHPDYQAQASMLLELPHIRGNSPTRPQDQEEDLEKKRR